jgi:hypothetical protein
MPRSASMPSNSRLAAPENRSPAASLGGPSSPHRSRRTALPRNHRTHVREAPHSAAINRWLAAVGKSVVGTHIVGCRSRLHLSIAMGAIAVRGWTPDPLRIAPAGTIDPLIKFSRRVDRISVIRRTPLPRRHSATGKGHITVELENRRRYSRGLTPRCRSNARRIPSAVV